MSLLQIHANDNVAVALSGITKGEVLQVGQRSVSVLADVDRGHKVALADIPSGAAVIKYGFPIGVATAAITTGEWVHTHNLATGLGDILSYSYNPEPRNLAALSPKTFQGYRRPDGKVGIRNEIWVVSLVGCVNRNAELIAAGAAGQLGSRANIDGVYRPHPSLRLFPDGR